jgi:hypothetical protein
MGFANSYLVPVLCHLFIEISNDVDIFFWTFIWLQELEVQVIGIFGIGTEELSSGGLFCTAFCGVVLDGAKLQLELC